MIIRCTIALWVTAIVWVILLALVVCINWVFNTWYKALCDDDTIDEEGEE